MPLLTEVGDHPAPVRVLAEGRLDPRSIVLRIAERIGQLWLVVLLVAYRDPTQATFYIAIGVFTIATSLIEYHRFRYRLTTTALEITAGVFTRRERRIPLDRIHDVSQSQSLFRRLLGLVTVNVETASSAGAEAKLDALAPAQADELRRALRNVTAAAEPVAQEAPERAVLHRSSVRELLLLGFTDNRAGLLVLGALLVLQELFEVAEERTARASVLLGQYLAQRMEYGVLSVVVYAVVFLLVLVLLGWIVSAVLTLLKFGG
ncbi:MAG: PH domain-containing protein, partial [Myxococcota bacterium]